MSLNELKEEVKMLRIADEQNRNKINVLYKYLEQAFDLINNNAINTKKIYKLINSNDDKHVQELLNKILN